MTWHEFGAQHRLSELLEQDANYGAVFGEVLANMESGFYGKENVDVVVQTLFGKYSLLDAMCYSAVHMAIMEGKIVRAQVDVGAEPRNDKEVKFHNDVLRSKKGSPFSGVFFGGLGEGDGFFSWDTPVAFSRSRFDYATDKESEDAPVVVAPAKVILEVGYTQSTRTCMHLFMSRQLARWPYGSRHVHLYSVVDETWHSGTGLEIFTGLNSEAAR